MGGLGAVPLAGMVAVVTGSARHIGRATAIMLAEDGAKVVLSDIEDAEGTAAAAAIREAGGIAVYQHADVRRPGEVEALAARAVREFGRLDIWVNNAYASVRGRVTELAIEDWELTIGVCLTAAFLGAKYAIPAMIASGGGTIVNIASVHALVAYPRNPAYDAAKAGLIGLTRQIAAEYGPEGIRANAVLPGLIVDKEKAEAAWIEQAVRHYPLRRTGLAADVAGAIRYLVSDAARFVTGAALVVDGGMTTRSPEWNVHP